jgi:hypothetical protein
LRARAGCGTYGAADDVSLRTQEAAGGLAVKVTDGFFLVGLSNVEADRTRNLQASERALVVRRAAGLVNQRRAIIAIEKARPASAPSTTRSRLGRNRDGGVFPRPSLPGLTLRYAHISKTAALAARPIL